MKLRTKFVLSIAPILVISLIINLWTTVLQFKKIDENTASLLIDIESEEIERSFEVLLDSVRLHLEKISDYPEIVNYLETENDSKQMELNRESVESVFDQYLNQYEHYQEISLILPFAQHSINRSIEQPLDISSSDLDALNNVFKKEKVAINVVHNKKERYKQSDGFSVQFAIKLRKSQAILNIYVKQDYISTLILDHKIGEEGIVLVTGSSNKVILAPNYSNYSDYIDQNQWLQLIAVDNINLIHDDFGYLVESFKLSDNLGFAMLWPRKNIFEILITDGLKNIIFGLLTLFAIIYIVSMFIKNKILKPIKKVIEVAQLTIKEGHSNNYKICNDEIGNLSRSFIKMGDELYQTSKKMEQLAFYDELTGLENRNKFLTCLEEKINEAKSAQQELGLLFLDLDGFKEVNDTLGHDAGDSVLKQVAHRLQYSIVQFDLSDPHEEYSISNISRLGGDEFALIVTNFRNNEVLKKISKFILNSLESPFIVDSEIFHLSCSIGVVMFPLHGINSDILLKNADTAMYKSKSLGKNQFQFYKQELTEITMQRYKLKSALRVAIENDELYLCFQPQMDLITKKIIGCEALIRWVHPELGYVDPSEFIHLAEESDLVLEIGEWVIEQSAIMAAKIANQKFQNTIKIAVNVSSIQLMRSNVPAIIKHHIEKNNLNQNAIEIEITETIMIDKGFRTEKSLLDIKNMGINIALDDFGTGYSSLSQIKDLPLNCIKIDKAFIHNCSANENAKNIVLAIIAMSKQLGFETTAEGIETIEEFDFLEKSGCNYAQGFAVSHPLKEDEFIEFIHNFNYKKMFK